RALEPGAPGRVQRKTEEHESAHAWQRLERLGLRGHATAERAAPGKQRQRRGEPCRLAYRRAHGGVTNRWRIRAAGALLHVRELEAQARNPQRCELARGGA